MTVRMPNRFRGVLLAFIAAAGVSALELATVPLAGQTPAAATYRAPRTADGKPDLNGIWQALNTANWDLQDHAAGPSPVVALGAAGAMPGGLGVVDGNEIPYRPEALA